MNVMDKRLILWLLANLLFIYFIKVFTIDPEVTSGNGNLALLLIPPTIISFIFVAKSLWKWLDAQPKRRVTIISCIVLFVASFLEYQFVTNLVAQLGGPPSVETSRIFRYPWLNQYTNTMFVNVYTFLIGVSLVLLLKGIFLKKISTS